MSNPAVVILTDPARCQLAEAETLVQALLEVQQLNKAGVPASQAFCDHPAAAMDFIEAYSKAYPALQLQTSDLPLPQHLYSMVADGRLSPLRPVQAAETAKLEQAGQPHPLFVLSLGEPAALMQALQHNGLAKSGIRVLEIAPTEQAKAEPVSVAEAVAAAPPARSSWLTERLSAPERDDGRAFGTDALADNSVELSSLEMDLDRIQIDSDEDRQIYDQSNHTYEPAARAVITAAAGPQPNPSSVSRQTTAEGTASSVGILDPATPSAASIAPDSEPVSDTSPAMPPEVPSSSITQSDVPPVVAELPSEADPKTPEEPPRNDMEPSEPPVGDPGEQDLATGGDPTHPALEPNQSQPDVDDTVAAGPSSPEGDDEDALAGHSCGFASPGEDVPYRPTASFSGEDDFAYALPPDDAGRPTFLASLFDFAESAEVIDPEAMYKELSEPLGEGGPALREIDFLVRRASDSGRLDPKAAEPAYSKGEVSVNPEPDEDEALNSALTTVHDADV